MTLEDSLIGHWPFNEGKANKVMDNSSYKFSGEVHKAKWIPGIVNNYALEFNGVDNYVQITRDNSAPKHFSSMEIGSISVWFRVDTIPLENGIMPIFYYGSRDPCTNMFDAANNGLIIEVGHSPVQPESRRLYYTVWANGCTYPSFCFDSNDPIIEKEWYHFVVVIDRNYNTGYLNGKEITNRRYNFGKDTDSQFFSSALANEMIWIGKGYWDGKPMYLNGAVDDLRIYHKPLNSEKVKFLYEMKNR